MLCSPGVAGSRRTRLDLDLDLDDLDGNEAHDNPGSPSFLAWRKLHLSRAKLKAINKTSALMSGFAMVAMVELQVNEKTKIPESLFVAFAVCTSLLVAVHMIALMISTCILPNIEAVSNLHSIMVVDESPHERMHWYIEASWAASTVLGTFLFLCELALLCWVKFYDTSTIASWAATIVIFPVLILFIVFAIHFYHKLVVHKYELSESGIRELEQLKSRLDDSGAGGGGISRGGQGSPSGGDAAVTVTGLQRINGRMAGIEVV